MFAPPLLSQVRYFVNNTVPEVRSKVAERNSAKLDFDAYKRRYEAKAKKGEGANSSLPALRQKLVCWLVHKTTGIAPFGTMIA